MKATVKLTGEQIDVVPSGMMSISCASYKDKNGRMIPATALEFEKNIDWEQRRYEIAKAAMQGFLSDSTIAGYKDGIAKTCIDIADGMIEQLKAK